VVPNFRKSGVFLTPTEQKSILVRRWDRKGVYFIRIETGVVTRRWDDQGCFFVYERALDIGAGK